MEGNQQIEKFDPAKLMEGVRDRIKSTFVSLIPDEMWSQMVEKEIYIFTTGKIVPHHEYKGDGKYFDWEERVPYEDKDIYDNWGNIKVPAEVSPLRKMIREELSAKFRANLKEYLEGEEYQASYNKYGKPEISKAIKKVLLDNADTIFFGYMESMMQSAFEQMRYRMQQGNY